MSLGDPPAPIRLLARLHDALLLLAADRYWNRVVRAGRLVGGRFGRWWQRSLLPRRSAERPDSVETRKPCTPRPALESRSSAWFPPPHIWCESGNFRKTFRFIRRTTIDLTSNIDLGRRMQPPGMGRVVVAGVICSKDWLRIGPQLDARGVRGRHRDDGSGAGQ